MWKSILPLSLVLAGSLAAIWLAGSSLPPRFDRAVPGAVGRALAAEVLKLRGATGSGRIEVFTRDTEPFPQPAHDALLAGLLRALADAGAPAPEVRKIALDPLRPMQVPPGDFHEVIRRAAPGDVVVSLMGPPFLTEEQRMALGTVKPRIVAFWPGTAAEYGNLAPMFEQHLLHAAVVSREPEPAAKPAAPGRTGPETFAGLYRVVTAAGPSAGAGGPRGKDQ